MRISATQIVNFQRMLDGLMTEADLIRELATPFSTNKYVEWGWAVEGAVQHACETHPDTIADYRLRNAKHDPAIDGSREWWYVPAAVINSYLALDCRPDMWQCKAEKRHKDITVVGVLDGISGLTGYELKTTSNDQDLYERYRDSWQHKVYYWLFGIQCMRYFVGVFGWDNTDTPVYRYTTEFVLWPNDRNAQEVEGIVELFADWRAKHNV